MVIKEINAGHKLFSGSKTIESDAKANKTFYATPILAAKDLISEGVALYTPAKPKDLDQPFNFFVRAGSFCNAESGRLATALETAGYTVAKPEGSLSLSMCTVFSPKGLKVTLTNRDIINICCNQFGYKFNPEVDFKLCFDQNGIINQDDARKGYMASNIAVTPLRLLDVDKTPELKQSGLSEFDVMKVVRENNLDGYQVTSKERCLDGSLVSSPVIVLNQSGLSKITGVTMAAKAPLTANHIDLLNFEKTFTDIHQSADQSRANVRARP
ncbi:hypothetical protein ACEUAI_18520 [Aeromonas veronii]